MTWFMMGANHCKHRPGLPSHFLFYAFEVYLPVTKALTMDGMNGGLFKVMTRS